MAHGLMYGWPNNLIMAHFLTMVISLIMVYVWFSYDVMDDVIYDIMNDVKM